MKKSTAINRLNKFSSKGTKVYGWIIEIIEGSKTIRPCYTSGSGRYISNQNHTSDIDRVLSLMNIKYTLTNDAPRGGDCGNLITVKSVFSV